MLSIQPACDLLVCHFLKLKFISNCLFDLGFQRPLHPFQMFNLFHNMGYNPHQKALGSSQSGSNSTFFCCRLVACILPEQDFLWWTGSVFLMPIFDNIQSVVVGSLRLGVRVALSCDQSMKCRNRSYFLQWNRLSRQYPALANSNHHQVNLQRSP